MTFKPDPAITAKAFDIIEDAHARLQMGVQQDMPVFADEEEQTMIMAFLVGSMVAMIQTISMHKGQSFEQSIKELRGMTK